MHDYDGFSYCNVLTILLIVYKTPCMIMMDSHTVKIVHSSKSFDNGSYLSASLHSSNFITPLKCFVKIFELHGK